MGNRTRLKLVINKTGTNFLRYKIYKPIPMKSVFLSLALLVTVVIASFAFRSRYEGSVIGTVTPAIAAGTTAWMISGTDTFKAEIKSAAFGFSGVKRGGYTLIVEARPPYRNGMKSNIIIADGTITNVGEIVLTQ